MSFVCQTCGDGFQNYRGLSSHKRHCIGRPEAVVYQTPQAEHSQHIENPQGSPQEGLSNTEEENDLLEYMIQSYMDEDNNSQQNMNDNQNNTEDDTPDAVPDTEEGSDNSETVKLSEGEFGNDILRKLIKIDECPRFSDGIWQKLTAEEKSDLLLLDILKGENLALFDKIKDWSRISKHELGFDPLPRHSLTSREKACDTTLKMFGFQHLLPKTRKITLPETGVEVDLVIFPFAKMLLSLLTDPHAMQPENLSFDVKDPFLPPKVGGPDGYYSDFNTGKVHSDAHKRYCKRANDLLCEITLFIDRTHLDNKGKHTVEPVLFTLGIFNQDFRNTDAAWRTLGYLPNLDLLAPHADSEAKSKDYHYCLRIILSDMVAMQKLGGLQWSIPTDGPDIQLFLQIPVNCVLGDTEGHDKIMGRHTDRSGRLPESCLCRYCDVPFKNLGNPMAKDNYSLTKSSAIRELRSNGSEDSVEQLKKLGYKSWHDGFLEVQFSDPERGLHGCTPAELLHAVQLGIFERCIESVFGAKKTAKKGSKRERSGKAKAVSNSGEVMKAMTHEDASSRNVFSKKAKGRVDELAKKLHRYLRWQSDGDLPRTSFPSGITNLSKMQGNERSGVLLILLIVLVLDHWALYRRRGKGAIKPTEEGYFEDAFGIQRHANIIKSLYLLLAFEAHMKMRKVSAKSLKYIKPFIPIFMDQVLRTFNREEGAKNNTVKNHLPLHYVEDLERFGCAQNFNSGTGEMILKPIVKETGRRTNMHSATFERQTGRRYIENLAILRARMEYDLSTNTRSSETTLQLQFFQMRISKTEMHNKTGNILDDCPNWKDSYIDGTALVTTIRERILSELPGTCEVKVYGRAVLGGQVYNANPSANAEEQSKQEWGYVDMGEDGIVPCQLLCVIEIPVKPSKNILLNNSCIDGPGVYFIVHMALSSLTEDGPSHYYDNQNEGTLAHVDQKLLHRIPKAHWDGTKWVAATPTCPASLFFVDTKSIVSPCIAFPDILSQNMENEFFFIRPVTEWGLLFEKEARNYARKEAGATT